MQLTAKQDHKRMMDLLKIASLRRGADCMNPTPTTGIREMSTAVIDQFFADV